MNLTWFLATEAILGIFWLTDTTVTSTCLHKALAQAQEGGRMGTQEPLLSFSHENTNHTGLGSILTMYDFTLP